MQAWAIKSGWGERVPEMPEERWEWMLDDPVMNRAKKTRQVLKGLEYTLNKCVFTMLALSYFL